MAAPFTRRQDHRPILAAISATLGLLFFLAWEVLHRQVFAYVASIYPLDPADEWRYTACSRLVAHGYRLFDQVFSAQPPLLFVGLSAAMRLFGESIAGARWFEVVCGLLCLVALGGLAWTLLDKWAAATSVVLLAVSPLFLVYSHTIEAEVPMAAFVTLGLYLAATSARKDSPLLLVVAGLSLAVAILLKLFALEALLPALWLVLWGRGPSSRVVMRGVLLMGAALVPVTLNFLLVSPRAQWQQVVAMHNSAATISLPNVTPPIQILGRFLSVDLGLTLLAVVGGVMLLVNHRWRPAGLVVLWLVGQLAMLFLFRPLFAHHPAILLPSLAFAGAAAVSEAGSLIRRRNHRWRLVGLALGALAYLLLLPRLAHADRHVLGSARPGLSETLASYVERTTKPSQLIAVDDLAVADEANRLVAPGLCDPSNVRLHAGYLTGADLIKGTRRYQVAMVLPSFGIFQQVAGYMHWLDRHYRRAHAPGGQVVYRRR